MLLLFSVAFGQAGLTAWAGGLSLSMGQSKAGSGSVAKTSTSRVTAPALTTAAAGSLNVNLDQYANKPGKGWQNGDLNGNNSAYGEGDVVPFRLALEGVAAGSHTIHLNYDFLTSGSEAYDFLATWNVTENPNKCADPNSGGASSHCPNNLGVADTHAFTGDSFSPAVSPGLTVNGAIAFAGVSRNLTMYGGTISDISTPTHDNQGHGDMVVTFTTTSDWAFFLWGAHIAQSAYWNESNGGDANGAATISGAPWHMRTQQLDDSSNKNQDRSIQPSALAVVQPNISVTKTADQGTINAGDTAAFTIVVTNNGPGTADNVTLNDPLPPGVAWSIDPAVTGCSISSGTLSCTFATMDEGASKTIHVSGVTDVQDCGTLSNTATVAADNEGSDQTDNTDTATITVNCPDLTITKTADAASVNAGSDIGFTVTLTNTGAGDATGVSINDALPGGTGVDWSIDSNTPASSCSITGTAPTQTLSCGPATVASGGSITVHVTSHTTGGSCGTYDNTASFTSTNDGIGNDSASTTVNCPNLTITKTADNASVNAGSDIGFTVTLSNTGAGDATGVSINDPLPGGTGVDWSIDSNTPASSCSISGSAPTQTLSCGPATVASGGSITVHVTSHTASASCAAYDNTASFTTTNDGTGNASASTTVDCPDVFVTKTADAPLVEGGDAIGFLITVGNNGPGTANGVTLTDTLPTNGGLDWTIDLIDGLAPGAQPPCSIDAGVLSCNFGSLAEGASHTVHVTSPTDGTSCGAVNNTATVDALNEPNTAQFTANDQASASLTVICPGITIVKTVSPRSGNPGDTVTYTYVVTNTGDTILFNVSVDDDVIGHIGDIATLEPGQSVTLTKDFVLPAGNPIVTNVGTATGTDVLGTQVSDNDDAFVTIVLAKNPPPSPPPTAFTGSDAARLGLIAGVLLALGLLGIVLGRRRREA
ncbi:MAG: DUF11 domain-containing protein [Actinobacteria bacterium]|nr:MAG: DUF11 domain-containing protein [Actinomycetota bacterium]